MGTELVLYQRQPIVALPVCRDIGCFTYVPGKLTYVTRCRGHDQEVKLRILARSKGTCETCGGPANHQQEVDAEGNPAGFCRSWVARHAYRVVPEH